MDLARPFIAQLVAEGESKIETLCGVAMELVIVRRLAGDLLGNTQSERTMEVDRAGRC